MHPGNIFVSYENPDDPKYCAVDFGIMGSLSESDQKYLALNFHILSKRLQKSCRTPRRFRMGWRKYKSR